MDTIFVSYRRSDSQGEAGRLFDELVMHFGESRVFMDVAAIEAGRDFRKAIDEIVAKCGVLLVVIGQQWLNATNESFTIRSWCLRRSDSATTDRTLPGPSNRAITAIKWMKRTTRLRIEEW